MMQKSLKFERKTARLLKRIPNARKTKTKKKALGSTRRLITQLVQVTKELEPGVTTQEFLKQLWRVVEFNARPIYLELRREPDNSISPFSIAVEDRLGRKLGNLPLPVSRVLAPLMDGGRYVDAIAEKVVKGWLSGSYYLRLRIEVEEEQEQEIEGKDTCPKPNNDNDPAVNVGDREIRQDVWARIPRYVQKELERRSLETDTI